MRVWKYDRGGIYVAPPFKVNKEGRKSVLVVVRYLLMEADQLGDATMILHADMRKIITYEPLARY
jgi:hypothetical protein